MQKYDIIFLGKSSFTEDLHNHFQSHVNTIIIDNTCIPVNFSSAFFPGINFIPSEKEVDYPFGYIASNNYRFELNPDVNVSKIFFSECFENLEELGEILLYEASFQINYLHQLIHDNFTQSPYKFLFKTIFKDYKNIIRVFKKLNIKDDNFIKFIEALTAFFSPGEYNNYFYSKYLLFSLISKKPYKMPSFELKTKQIITNEILKEIRYSEKGFELIFENIKLEGKFLISTIPPHIFDLSGIKHLFNHHVKEIFYNISFKNEIPLPTYLPEEIIYFNDRNFWFITIKNNELNLYKKDLINKIPERDEIAKLFANIFPHIDPLPEYTINPHIFLGNQPKDKKKLNLNKNFFFTKNFEYPYYGSDGETLYRNIIKETIWKKLLL